MGFYNAPIDNSDWRRSVSMSGAMSDMDDRPDYSPLASPTFRYPDSPSESTVGGMTPEGSPTIPDKVQVPARPPIQSRSTSFAQAVEMANKSAAGASKAQDGGTPTPFIASQAQFADNAIPTETSTDTVNTDDSAGSKAPVDAETPTKPRDDTIDTPATKAQGDAQSTQTILTDSLSAEPKPISVAPTLNASDAPVQITVSLDGVGVEPVTPTPAAAVHASTSAAKPATPVDGPTSSIIDSIPSIGQSVAEHLKVEQPSSTVIANKHAGRNKQELTLDAKALVTPSITLTEDAADATPTSASFIPPPLPPGISPLSSGTPDTASMRPFSSVELAWAEHMTPATGRGNVLFIPPSAPALARKADLLDHPDTPQEGVSIGKSSDEAQEATDAAPAQAAVEPASAVPASLRPQQKATPVQTSRKEKRKTVLPSAGIVPASPGGKELMALLENAMMLQSSLEIGELPADAAKRRAEEERQAAALANAIASDKARAQQEEEKLLAFRAEPKPSAEEEEINRKAKMRHTFLIPLAKAKEQHKQEASVARHSSVAANGGSRDLLSKPSTPSAPELPALPERLPSPGAASPVSLPPASPPLPSPPSLTVKSASANKSRFSTFRRFGSIKSVIGGSNNSGSSASRPSVARSRTSDESAWSTLVPTLVTPDTGVVHGSIDEFGMASVENGRPPSVKKHGVNRASTFGKVFGSRSRKKSSGTLSTISGHSDGGNSKAASIYTLPPLPDSLSVLHPDRDQDPRQARKSLSMKSLKSAMKGRSSVDTRPPVPSIRRASPPPPIATEAASPTSTLGSLGSPLRSPDYIGFGTMDIPSDRPTSMMSIASTLPSPLFDTDMFEAFPAVPSSSASHGGSLDAALMTPSFDSAFLGSAIHLAGSNKSTFATPLTASPLTASLPPQPATAQSQGIVRSATRRDNKF